MCVMLDEEAQEASDKDNAGAPRAAPIAPRATLASKAKNLDAALKELSPAERMARLRRELKGPIVFTLGFGIEGQVLFHWICERGIDIDVVTLDTGRLFPETYALWAETERRYGRKIRPIYPDHAALERLVAKQGIDGFYDSKRAREACCDVRKARPLDRALAGASAWIAGLRADQSPERRDAGLVSVDASRKTIKVNPLFDWSRDAVMAVAKANRIPINPLHAKGFASIGCAPCTRAIAPGEPERNGRWWWENDSSRECGLHRPRRAGRAASEPAEPAMFAGCG
ncbi:MAG TPA: phosphoadenylyl-sulfate reductase [Pseudolabrys sp.]|nr:phosphoadenylyl-sulfate reductase [Pseudolabrys sp.]